MKRFSMFLLFFTSISCRATERMQVFISYNSTSILATYTDLDPITHQSLCFSLIKHKSSNTPQVESFDTYGNPHTIPENIRRALTEKIKLFELNFVDSPLFK